MKVPREERTAAEDAYKRRDFSGLGRGRLIAISKYNCLNLLEIVHYVFRAQCQCSGFPWCFKNVGPTKCLNFRDKKYCKMAGNSRKGKSSPNKIRGKYFLVLSLSQYLPGRRLEPVIKCCLFLSFFQLLVSRAPLSAVTKSFS